MKRKQRQSKKVKEHRRTKRHTKAIDSTQWQIQTSNETKREKQKQTRETNEEHQRYIQTTRARAKLTNNMKQQ